MLSISPGASPPASPMEEMCTKPNRRVRDWGTTPWRKLPKVYAPASPADTAVVTAVIGTSSSAGSPMPRCGTRCVCRSTRPGVTSLPVTSIRWTARAAGMLVSTAAIWPCLIPRSRLPRSRWLGSSNSPFAITRSNLSPGSFGSKPWGAGAPAWAIRTGVALAPAADVWPASVAPAAAADVETMKLRRETHINSPPHAYCPAELSIAAARHRGAYHLPHGCYAVGRQASTVLGNGERPRDLDSAKIRGGAITMQESAVRDLPQERVEHIRPFRDRLEHSKQHRKWREY